MVGPLRGALAYWEPRVDVTNVVVYPSADLPTLLNIDITYVIKGENDERNLVYPFYTIPEEGEE